LFLKIFFTAEFLGQMLYYTRDNAQALVDTGLIVIPAALIQAGKCNIDRGMVVAATHKILNLLLI
jgi:hypothetical protein